MPNERINESRRNFLKRDLPVSVAGLAISACGNTRDDLKRINKPRPKISHGSVSAEIKPEDVLLIKSDIKKPIIEVVKKVEGNRWIGRLSGNGNREVIIYIPKGSDASKPFELIYHFHGTDSHLIGEEIPELPNTSKHYKKKVGDMSVGANRIGQVLKSSEEIGEEGKRNIIVVYPISKGRRGKEGSIAHKNAYDDDWMKKGNDTGDDMGKLHTEVLSALEEDFNTHPKIDKITAKGHSAGGRPLQHIASSGFKLDRIDFLDASYGKWAKRCYEDAIRFNPDLEMNLFVTKGHSTNRSAKKLDDKKGVEVIATRKSHGNMNQEFFGWERGK